MRATYHLSHLRTLEAEAVHVMREAAAEFAEHGFDAAFGGARRNEERARAREHDLSFRDEFGRSEPHRQRPEVWSLYNGRIRRGEHARVFPISNWTELDVWQYIAEEGLEVPSICFAHEREVFTREGMLYALSPYVELIDGEQAFSASVDDRVSEAAMEDHKRQGCFR
jgi:sulfate adenylyltransferase subunit 2